MSFTWPWALVLLILIPLLAALYIWMQHRRQRYALQYASVSLVRQAVGSGPGIRRHIPAALYLVAMTAMIFALARPTATVPVPSNTGTIVLVIDVSGSMLAEDVSPNRMEATKDAVRDFINKQPKGIKIGVVSFSDFGAVVAPPTSDKKTVTDAVTRLRIQSGTNMGSGLLAAYEAIYQGSDGAALQPLPGATPTPIPAGSKPAASIVLISDGDSNIGTPPLEVAQEAVAAGIKIYTIGIGTEAGTIVRIRGRSEFTRLDEATLRAIADQTGGAYFNAQDEDELRQIYDDLARERQFEDEETELTFALTAVAMLVSLVAGGLGLLWFNRLP